MGFAIALPIQSLDSTLGLRCTGGSVLLYTFRPSGA